MFVAVRPPRAAVEHLESFLGARRPTAGLRWTAPDQLHLTLAFLGEVPDGAVGELAERLDRAAHRRRPFGVRVAGGGAFPRVAAARVLWAGLGLAEPDAEELRRLATGVRAAARRAGITVGDKRFRPHVTLARLGAPQDVAGWVDLLDGYAGPGWDVTRIELVASYLGQGAQGRARHEVVHTATLD